MVHLVIRRDYPGPSVLELDRSGLLQSASRTVEAAWDNSTAEIATVRRFPGVTFVLYVPDISTMSQAANSLGIPAPLPAEELARGISTIRNAEASDWRAYSTEVGSAAARTLLVRAASDEVRKGKNPRRLRRVLDQCLIRGVSAADADVLLGLTTL